MYPTPITKLNYSKLYEYCRLKYIIHSIMDVGYIYIRSNEYWDTYGACKLGKTTNIPDREQTYITSELKRGTYIMVIEVDCKMLDTIEIRLQSHFTNLHIQFNGGREFYNKAIVHRIIPYFDDSGITYTVLSTDEIEHLTRTDRETVPSTPHEDVISDDAPAPVDSILDSTLIYTPRNYQEDIKRATCEYFTTNDAGVLVIPCGVGKTLIALWIVIAMATDTILIGVPSKLLLKQWKDVVGIIFPNIPCLLVSGEVDTEHIMRFLITNRTNCIVITTYSSSYKVYAVTTDQSFVFNMVINDEVHHLTSQNVNLSRHSKTFIQMLNIPFVKRLSLTATLKQLENADTNADSDDNNSMSTTPIANNSVEHFGKIIDRKCMLWAINLNIICDYSIQTIIADENQLNEHLIRFNITEDENKRLFLGAYVSLKSIFDCHSHHLLIYVNNLDNSRRIADYIKILIDAKYFIIPDMYYSVYHGDMNQRQKDNILNCYNSATVGIIVCIYCLGEGYDNCRIDGTVFAENMSSNVRIVQSAQRACRKDIQRPTKIAKIILPILGDWLNNPNNSDLKKIREVVYQMGLEDETVIQKIKVIKIGIVKHTNVHTRNNAESTNFGEYDEELTQRLLLKTTPRTSFGVSYEKAKRIIATHSPTSKEAYYTLCERDTRLPKEPESVFKGRFTNWIDYLSIERIYYDIKTCITKVNEYLKLHPTIQSGYLDLSTICKELCSLDCNFPPNGLWIEYYAVSELRDIIRPTIKKKRAGLTM
jgi:superfamily II DNA or RNA helicase